MYDIIEKEKKSYTENRPVISKSKGKEQGWVTYGNVRVMEPFCMELRWSIYDPMYLSRPTELYLTKVSLTVCKFKRPRGMPG